MQWLANIVAMVCINWRDNLEHREKPCTELALNSGVYNVRSLILTLSHFCSSVCIQYNTCKQKSNNKWGRLGNKATTYACDQTWITYMAWKWVDLGHWKLQQLPCPSLGELAWQVPVSFRENLPGSYHRQDGEGCGGGGRSRCEWCRMWRGVAQVQVLTPTAGQWSVHELFSGYRNDPRVQGKEGILTCNQEVSKLQGFDWQYK